MLETAALVSAAVFAMLLAISAALRQRDVRRARARHPAGSVCPDCVTDIDDWATHRRLFHSPRVKAPEDMW